MHEEMMQFIILAHIIYKPARQILYSSGFEFCLQQNYLGGPDGYWDREMSKIMYLPVYTKMYQ